MACESCTTLTAKLSTLEAECTSLKAKLSAIDETDKAECTAVGLSVGAGATARLVAVQGVAKFRADLRALTGTDSDAAALGAITAWKNEAGEVAKLKAEHAKTEQVSIDAELAAVIAAGVKDGKLAKAEAHPARVLLLKQATGVDGKPTRDSVAWLKAYLEASTPIVTTKATEQEDADGEVKLTAEELELAKRHGKDPVVMLKAKQALEGQRRSRESGRRL